MNAKILQTHEIRRTFPSSGVLLRGDLVDASEWRNRALLERQGYIVPIEEPEKTAAKPDEPVPHKKDIKNDGDDKTAKAEKTDTAAKSEAEIAAESDGDDKTAETETVIEFEIADELAAKLEDVAEVQPAVKTAPKKTSKK